MLGFIALFIIFGYLARREKKSMHGSVVLMAITTVAIWAIGFFATIAVCKEVLELRPGLWVYVPMYGFFIVGYGVYHWISKAREKAYYARLEMDE